MTRRHQMTALTRHFVGGLFDLGFLSEAGSASFTRLILGACVVFFSFGLLLARVYMAKYAVLAALSDPEPYRRAVLADEALLIAVAMWVVAFVTTLVSHALVPNETDYRVLIPLPITRRAVFGAKLLAIAVFTGLFMVSVQVALMPTFLLISISRWASSSLFERLASYLAAMSLACVLFLLATAAVQGLLVLCAPPHRALPLAAALKSAILCALVLVLPFINQLPSHARAFGEGQTWLVAVPPAWFVGVDLWLQGDRREAVRQLARTAMVSITLASAVAIGAYAVLYRKFERVLWRSGDLNTARTRGRVGASHLTEEQSNLRAIRTFIWITLRRSLLHQGLLIALTAMGVAVVANDLMGADLAGWLLHHGAPPMRLVHALTWAPFALMFIGGRAARLALLVPLDQRANWVFRMTERPATRADQLSPALSMVRLVGVFVPAAVLLPLQALVFGRDAVAVAIAALLLGSLHVELLMRNWARIPFTCSYVPGKQFVPLAMLKTIGSFLLFTLAGVSFTAAVVATGRAGWILDCVVIAAILLLRRWRLDSWQAMPLEFEDLLPSEVNPLRLS